MPKDAPLLKIDATRGYGANIIFFDRYKDDIDKIIEETTKSSGMTFISPLDQSRTSSARSSMRRRPTIVKPSLESRLSEKGSALLKNFNQSRLSIKK